mmetsp:Transcript_39611/g.51907  ORF Transcript_39611/g.51907 Transcript_39611/m.51907 type:complete len:148 (+) Transcript_39611:46-489(+)
MMLRRAFASVSASDLSTLKRQDVLSATDSKWVASYAQAVVESGDAAGNHSDNLDEYFRKNFRKISSAQALDVINSLSKVSSEPAGCLDSRFWVWESLEEAVRAEIDTMSQEEFNNTATVFNINYKGSTDLKDLIENRIYRDADVFGK